MAAKTVLFISVIVLASAYFFNDQIHNKLHSVLGICPHQALLSVFPTFIQDLFSEIGNSGDVHMEERIFTKDELSKYDGSEGSPGLFLAVMGKVFDVSKGERFYKPGGGYGFFSGKDGTRGFVTGEFTEKGLVDHVTGFESSQMMEVEHWVEFYQKDYTYVGKVIGNFYDEKGEPTAALKDAWKAIKAGHQEKDKTDEDKRKFPPCNSEFIQDKGGRVWCTKRSGGIERDWVGVPRKYHRPGQKNTRCACVKTTGAPTDQPDTGADRGDLDNPNFREYETCDPTSESCKLMTS